MNDSHSSWDKPIRQVPSLPGQMSIFDVISDIRDSENVTPTTAMHPELFDTGRDLPGAGETRQRLIWDV